MHFVGSCQFTVIYFICYAPKFHCELAGEGIERDCSKTLRLIKNYFLAEGFNKPD
jgi:hypothetical protein